MKFGPNQEAIVESTDVLITEAETEATVKQVYRDEEGKYHVVSDGIVRHPAGTAEDAMRALGFYLHGTLYREQKLQRMLADTSQALVELGDQAEEQHAEKLQVKLEQIRQNAG